MSFGMSITFDVVSFIATEEFVIPCAPHKRLISIVIITALFVILVEDLLLYSVPLRIQYH